MTEGEFKRRMHASKRTRFVHINDIEEAKQDFPLEFWIEELTEGNPDNEGPPHYSVKRRPMANAKLPENRANARVREEKVIDWYMRWFGT